MSGTSINAVAAPAWLATMRAITGTLEAPGAADNPVILAWAREIAARYPDMTGYCAQYNHDSIAWCGLTVAYCMAANGMRPPFDPADDLASFLWVDAWADWGTNVGLGEEQPGDVLVFKPSPHHVSLYERTEGNYYVARGGNQSDAVNESKFAIGNVFRIRRPPGASSIPAPSPLPPPAAKPGGQFERCVALTLAEEGGNDDDPRDPGGRTSRGILQREWDQWRRAHPGLPGDVWEAPQSQVLAIYRVQYWDALRCDDLPAGIDHAVFDYGVNSGIGRAAKALQGFVGTDVDGEVGPLTIRATAAFVDRAGLVERICDQRMDFLRGLSTWPTFGRGWTARVGRVRAAAIDMVTRGGASPMPPVIDSDPDPLPPAPPPALPPVARSGQPPGGQLGQWIEVARTVERAAARAERALLALQAAQAAAAANSAPVPPAVSPAGSLPTSSPVPAAAGTGGLGTGLVALAASLFAMSQGWLGMPVGEGATMAGAAVPIGAGLTAILGGLGRLQPVFSLLGRLAAAIPAAPPAAK